MCWFVLWKALSYLSEAQNFPSACVIEGQGGTRKEAPRGSLANLWVFEEGVFPRDAWLMGPDGILMESFKYLNSF